jgi:hypothetical protein
MSNEFRAKGSPADFHSVTIDLADGSKSIHRTSGVTSFDINDQVDREKMRAQGRYAKGLTTGEYDADGALEWMTEEWTTVSAELGLLDGGVYGFKGNLTIAYTEQNGKPMTVVAQGVMFKTRKRSGKQGTEGMKIQTDLDVEGKVFENGVGPFGEKL